MAHPNLLTHDPLTHCHLWSARSELAVSGDQDHRPHGDSVRDGRQRPDVRLQTRVDTTDVLRQPVCVMMHGPQRLDEDAGDEVERVDDGKCP